LAQLWLFFRAARARLKSDKDALAHIANQEDIRITGSVKVAWLKQLTEKAKRNPLVQMIESDNPSDREFAPNFLAVHSS
jgi:hypothetical protein